MSSIGSGPGIGTGHIELNGIRAINGGEPKQIPAEAPPVSAQPAAKPVSAHSNQAAAMVSASALDAGEVPVDGERVSQIRKAISSGNYPLMPTRISDAMIAAGILLQVSK